MTFWLYLALGALVLATIVAIFRARRESARDSDRTMLPALVFFPPKSEMTVTPPPSRVQRQMRPAPVESRVAIPTTLDAPPSYAPRQTEEPSAPPRASPPAAPAAAPGTLVMLPGRLEVVAGESLGRDVRFVRTGANGTQKVTLGRGEGDPYEHVQLRARTVSRRHAQLNYADGHWSIVNLSHTNPLVLNGDALLPDMEPRMLDDGDMIELGEVIFRFRDH